MAKISKPKNRQPALNSRAARRANSPSLAGNIDKSLLSIPRPSSSPRTALAPTSSGITKKMTRKTKMSRSQRIRHEKGLSRADCVRDQFQVKYLKSGEREKKIKDRRKGWEEINETTANELGDNREKKGMGRFGILAESEDMDVEDLGSDEAQRQDSPEGIKIGTESGKGTTSQPAQDDDGEIL